MKGLAAAFLFLFANPAAAQLVIAPPTPPPPPLPTDADLALGEADTRMTVPVSIGARGPWGFIIDTGSERTVVSRELAGILGLGAGPSVRVTAMTGTSDVATVIVPALGVSTIARRAVQAPALAARNLGAAGLLGIDSLQGHRVDIDFDAMRMTLRPSPRRAVRAVSAGDEIVIVAKSVYGQLIVTDAHVRGTRIAVVIDTGSSATIGNPALFAAVAKPKPLGTADLIAVTGERLAVRMVAVDDIEIGGVGFDNVPIAFADAAPFHRFHLQHRPALLLGMDTLRLFRRVGIDFTNRAIRLTLPRGRVANRRASGGWSPAASPDAP